MFRNKRDEQKQRRFQAADTLCDAVPMLSDLQNSYKGISVTGISISKSKRGDGYLSILRIQVKDFPDAVELVGERTPGHYVVWGFGDDPLEALADLEAQLQAGEASLAEDKYAKKRR